VSEKQLEKTAHAALKKIQDKKYTTRFAELGICNMVLIGLAFYGKHVKLLSTII
jgi:hypothetical protein